MDRLDKLFRGIKPRADFSVPPSKALAGAGHAVSADMLADAAYPYPSVLRTPLTTFMLESPIYIGARSDLDASRFFLGKLALLKIYSSPLSDAEANCLFHAGDAVLQDASIAGAVRWTAPSAVIGAGLRNAPTVGADLRRIAIRSCRTAHAIYCTRADRSLDYN